MSADPRQDALKHWLQQQAPRSVLRLEPASSDASFRRYFRVYGLGEDSLIAMDAPPEQEDVGPFLAVAARLREAGIRVPECLAEDRARGFLLLSDLGRQTYLQAFEHEPPEPLMEAAVECLVRMQKHTAGEGLPLYDRALLMRELSLFSDWYLERHLGLSLDAGRRTALADWYERLCERALAQPRVFVHRDFMPRNLMASEPPPGVIDFQDAVLGPVSYDPVCLFMDAFWSFSPQTVEAGLRHYHRLGLAAGLPLDPKASAFLSDCRWMGVHRHLKVIGIFARIAHRDGKPQYLADVPRFFEYLRQAAEAEAELAPLWSLLAEWLPRSESRGARA